MDGVGTHSGLIDTFYEAALEPAGWAQVLERVADAVSAESAALQFTDQITGEGRMLTARADPAAPPLYFEYFSARNPIRPKRNKALDLLRNPVKWRRMVVNDEHVLEKAELMRSEYYGDFLRPFCMHSVLMAGLALEGTRFGSLSLMRSARRDQFGSAEIGLLGKLQPDLIRAFELGLKLRDLHRMGASVTEMLDRSPHAVFLVDGTGRVCYLNRSAECLVRSNTVLAVSSGALCAIAAGERGRLRAAIGAAAAVEADRRSGCAFTLPRASGPALAVMVSPMRSERFTLFSTGPLVLICASDPVSSAVMPAQRLRQLYGLTPAEAKVAIELLSGADAKEIAERQSLSIHTVRVHIARILAKTETSRQAELVRLLARVCGMPFQEGGCEFR